ncbi:MAG: PAS domain-containing protein, partial [Rudaea sp.]|nr:PAS domain-containing protein [Rudaea sp.]
MPPLLGLSTRETGAHRDVTPEESTSPKDANEEISSLIEALHNTEKRLEELTAGEIDTVADSDGRTLLLRRAQEELRHSEAEKQAAILNALPAHVALLDSQGFIVSVNRSWRQFADANALAETGSGIGLSYLETCDVAGGARSAEARPVADGIRSVLHGTAKSFSLEYPCHSPTQKRWFLLLVVPLARDPLIGAVVMHVDVTAERQAEEGLRASELRFRQIAENIHDVFFLQNLDGSQIYYVSPAYEKIWGRTCDSLY